MKSKIFLIFYTFLISLITIGLIVCMVIHASKGLAGGNQKLVLGAYILMVIWALMKLHTAVKSLRDSSKNDR